MAAVLKQDSLVRGSSMAEPLVFNTEDIQSQARSYLLEIQNQAAQLMEQAKQECLRIKQHAHQEGVQAAQAEMQRLVDETAAKLSDQRCKSAIEACEQTVTQISHSTTEWLTTWRNQTVILAAKIAEKLVRARMGDENELLRVWMEEAIVAMRDERELRILVHPDDFAIAGRFLQSLSRTVQHAGNVEVVPDPETKPGGCVVKSKNGQIDQQLETQLKRLVDQLNS